MNGGVQSYLATLEFKNGEQLGEFNSRILRPQQESMLSGEIVSPTILLFHYTKEFPKSDKLRNFIALKMKNLITFLDNNGKYAVYTGGEINGIYRYLEIIGFPTTLATSGKLSHQFIHSYTINNDTSYIQPVIASLRTRHKSICECCGIIGHKADACIIRGPKFLPPSLIIKMNNFNNLHGDEPNESPKYWSSQPPADHFK